MENTYIPTRAAHHVVGRPPSFCYRHASSVRQMLVRDMNLEKIVLLVFVLACPRLVASSPVDEEAIHKLETQQAEAWNKHDAKAYASLFTEDGDCVNVVGWWWKGRRQIEEKLTAAYAFVFRESVL